MFDIPSACLSCILVLSLTNRSTFAKSMVQGRDIMGEKAFLGGVRPIRPVGPVPLNCRDYVQEGQGTDYCREALQAAGAFFRCSCDPYGSS
jgi:hypothetical protein